MNILTPVQAATIASGVYGLRERTVSELHDRGEKLGCESMFAVSDKSRFEAKSGSLMWKKLSGFGYIAAGTGKFEGDVLVVCRGTDIRNDWLTNFNMGVQLGTRGTPVHAGFNEVFKTFSPGIREFIRGRNPTRFHCVGHSLGGALASLTADMLSVIGAGDIALYTFGSPRVGDGFFARSLTKHIGADNIFRVAHPADPVPMIPLFPFWHLPFGKGGMHVAATSNALISVEAHNMEKSYIPGVSAQAGWAGLSIDSGQAAADLKTRAWLDNIGQEHGKFMMGSASLMAMIGKALSYLLRVSGLAAAGGAGVALTAGATVIDQLSWALQRAAHISKQIGMHVFTLMRAICGFLGRTMVAAADLTLQFLRWLLELFYNSLRSIAIRALRP